MDLVFLFMVVNLLFEGFVKLNGELIEYDYFIGLVIY